MFGLVAAYYSAATNKHYCVYGADDGNCSARVLKDGKWVVIKNGNRSAIYKDIRSKVDNNLRLWLMSNDPAAMKLNFVPGTFPDHEKIRTPLRRREPIE